MKIQNRTIIITVLAFLIGGVSGGYLAYRATINFAVDQSMLEIATDAQIEISALRGLREKDHDGVVELMEAYLDSRIISLRNDGNDSSLTKVTVHRVIKLAKDYRAKYPRKTKFPENDAAVSKILNEDNDR